MGWKMKAFKGGIIGTLAAAGGLYTKKKIDDSAAADSNLKVTVAGVGVVPALAGGVVGAVAAPLLFRSKGGDGGGKKE